MNVTDDAVRETHGAKCSKLELGGAEKLSAVVIWESDYAIHLKGCYETREITIWQARYLARKLYRLARRIEKRQEADNG